MESGGCLLGRTSLGSEQLPGAGQMLVMSEAPPRGEDFGAWLALSNVAQQARLDGDPGSQPQESHLGDEFISNISICLNPRG